MNSTYIRKQDAVYVYQYTSINPVGTYLVWDLFKSQFKKVYETWVTTIDKLSFYPKEKVFSVNEMNWTKSVIAVSTMIGSIAEKFDTKNIRL